MIYFAHRGNSLYSSVREIGNTVMDFEIARREGARCFELDVHLLKDGKLAVYHDYFLMAPTGEKVKMADLSAEELKKYPLREPCFGRTFQIPLLTDVLPVVIPELQVLNIELKNDNNVYPSIEETLLKTLSAYPELESKILFSSFDYETLKRLRALAPQARLGLLTRKFDINEAVTLGTESVHLNWIRFTPEIAAACHEQGIKVYLYTVNDKATARRLEKEGADGFFTDRIDLFV